MIVGLLSDTHGQVRRAAAALQLLDRLGAAALIHCGDIGSLDVLDLLAGRRAWAVWGNTDDETSATARYAAPPGLTVASRTPLPISLAGRELLVFHGHEPALEELLREAHASSQTACSAVPRYVLHGHTHRARDVRIGPLRVVNPGALHRAAPHTVATLDLPSDRVRFWVVREPAGAAPEEFIP